jgi:hypothetical protein
MMTPAQAREWKDVTGLYKLEADLIGFDDEMVILQRADKELGSCKISELCEADREYLKSKEAQETQAVHSSNLEKQTWTMKSGLKVVGRIVDYGREELTIQRRQGKIFVNDKPYTELPDVYQTMLPNIIAHLEPTTSQTMRDKRAFDLWVRSLQGKPKTYTLEGVVFQLESGDEYKVPFFLFGDKEQELLKQGWNAWLKDHGKLPEGDDQPTEQERDEHAVQLSSLAAAYQQNEEINRRIAVMNLNMQAIQSGLTSAWEVTLYPGQGNPYPPRWVVVTGRNSEVAKANALAQSPQVVWIFGPIRKVSY